MENCNGKGKEVHSIQELDKMIATILTEGFSDDINTLEVMANLSSLHFSDRADIQPDEKVLLDQMILEAKLRFSLSRPGSVSFNELNLFFNKLQEVGFSGPVTEANLYLLYAFECTQLGDKEKGLQALYMLRRSLDHRIASGGEPRLGGKKAINWLRRELKEVDSQISRLVSG